MHGSISADCAVGKKITSQCADPDRDWDGVCDACERTCSSNHEPNQEADRDPKRLSEGDSFLCEQALYQVNYMSGMSPEIDMNI